VQLFRLRPLHGLSLATRLLQLRPLHRLFLITQLLRLRPPCDLLPHWPRCSRINGFVIYGY
jgi:hypothetical protein